MVVPRRWCSRLISMRISTRSLASRFDSGSSKRNRAGSRPRAPAPRPPRGPGPATPPGGAVAQRRGADGGGLALAARQLRWLAVEQRLDLQQFGDAVHCLVLLASRNAAAFHAEGD